MRHNGSCVLLCVMFAFAAPLGAEVNQDEAAISAALNSGNSNQALILISQAFSALRPDQSGEAKTLIQSILPLTPIESAGKVVAEAIEANPALGNAILTAISGTSQTEQLAILNRVSFMASQEPQSFSQVSESLPKMVNAVDANLSVSQKFTAPDYNPSNLLSETGVMMSPTIPQLRKDLIRDERDLAHDLEQLLIDEQEHKSKQVIEKEEEKIKEIRQDIKEIRQEIKEDRGH
jgi:hypothetical protein